MYALYSFFGGRANVCAPMVYQVFAESPITFGMRLETRLRAHEHLVKQHFVPKDVHTLDRKDAVVTALLDPGAFSEPFAIASRAPRRYPARGISAYERLIDGAERPDRQRGAQAVVPRARLRAHQRVRAVSDRGEEHELAHHGSVSPRGRHVRDCSIRLCERLDSVRVRAGRRPRSTPRPSSPGK